MDSSYRVLRATQGESERHTSRKLGTAVQSRTAIAEQVIVAIERLRSGFRRVNLDDGQVFGLTRERDAECGRAD